MTIIKDYYVEKDLVDYCFEKWGRASGWHKCPTSTLYSRTAIRNYAYQGCWRAIREYDRSKFTKKGEPVNLKSWCIIVMKSHVNTCKRPSIWRKERVLNCEFANSEAREYKISLVPDTDTLYDVLVLLVQSDLKKKSREHFIAFVFRIVYQLTFDEIANIMRLSINRLMEIFKEIVPVVQHYGRSYCHS